MDLSADAGSVDVSGTVNDTAKVEVNAGSVTLRTPRPEQYGYALECNMGQVEMFGEVSSSLYKRVVESGAAPLLRPGGEHRQGGGKGGIRFITGSKNRRNTRFRVRSARNRVFFRQTQRLGAMPRALFSTKRLYKTRQSRYNGKKQQRRAFAARKERCHGAACHAGGNLRRAGRLAGRPAAGAPRQAHQQESGLLALLAINGRAPLSNEALAGLLWTGEEPHNPAGTLKNAAYSLRRLLEQRGAGRELITVEDKQYRLASDLVLEVDLWRAGQLAEQAVNQPDPGPGAGSLAGAGWHLLRGFSAPAGRPALGGRAGLPCAERLAGCRTAGRGPAAGRPGTHRSPAGAGGLCRGAFDLPG